MDSAGFVTVIRAINAVKKLQIHVDAINADADRMIAAGAEIEISHLNTAKDLYELGIETPEQLDAILPTWETFYRCTFGRAKSFEEVLAYYKNRSAKQEMRIAELEAKHGIS